MVFQIIRGPLSQRKEEVKVVKTVPTPKPRKSVTDEQSSISNITPKVLQTLRHFLFFFQRKEMVVITLSLSFFFSLSSPRNPYRGLMKVMEQPTKRVLGPWQSDGRLHYVPGLQRQQKRRRTTRTAACRTYRVAKSAVIATVRSTIR